MSNESKSLTPDITPMLDEAYNKAIDDCLFIINAQKPIREPFEVIGVIYNKIEELKSKNAESQKFDPELNCPPMKPIIK